MHHRNIVWLHIAACRKPIHFLKQRPGLGQSPRDGQGICQKRRSFGITAGQFPSLFENVGRGIEHSFFCIAAAEYQSGKEYVLIQLQRFLSSLDRLVDGLRDLAGRR